MAYGHLERAWTYAEYVKEYEQLQAKNDKLVGACRKIKKHEEGCLKRNVGYDSFVYLTIKAALAEGD